MNFRQIFQDFNSAAFWAGVSTFVFMLFGALTLQISIIEQFDITEAQAGSWLLITWLVPALASAPFILRYRQPLMIGWTLPGLVYMGSLADRFTFEEFAGANAVAGAAIIGLGMLGAGRAVIRLVPMPVLMGMFAASLLGFVTRMVEALPADIAVAGPMVASYVAARALGVPRIPPVGVAVLVGAVMVALVGGADAEALTVAPPALLMPGMVFSLDAILTLSLPMVVLVIGLGNTQGLGFLVAQGYRVPADGLTVAAGAMSMVNALFGGHPAAMTRVSTAMAGGPAAGPLPGRYWAAVLALAGSTGVALAAGLIVSAVAVLPAAYVLVVAGLAIFASFEDSLARAFAGTLRTGSAVAFAVTLSTFSIAGVPSAFWALLAGIGASLLLERAELLAYWRPAAPSGSTAEAEAPGTASLQPSSAGASR